MKYLKRKLSTVAFFIVFVIIWEIAFKLQIWSPVLLPSPLSVFAYIYHSISDKTLPIAVWVTFKRLVIGYIIGLAGGMLMGFLSAQSKTAESTIGITALGLQTLPSVCWVPLALLWFGQTEYAVHFVVIMGTIWAMAISVADGIRTIPPIYAKAARTMGINGINLLLFVNLPATLPHLISGMKQSWAFAWRSLMAAEIYVTILTGFGLGHLLHYGRELHAMDQVLGVMLVITVMGLLITKMVFSPFERILAKRWGTHN